MFNDPGVSSFGQLFSDIINVHVSFLFFFFSKYKYVK